jgi:hypothetical protein
MRTVEMEKLYPLPWKHHCDECGYSAVLCANGSVDAGSLLMRQPQNSATANRQAHALIVKLVNNHAQGKTKHHGRHR